MTNLLQDIIKFVWQALSSCYADRNNIIQELILSLSKFIQVHSGYLAEDFIKNDNDVITNYTRLIMHLQKNGQKSDEFM